VATRPTRPALRARYDRRRDEVIVGAARVFADRGYDQTSMQELAEELGIAAGGLYHYFRGKEELLIAICDELTDPLLERVAELARDGREPAIVLRDFVRLWIAHLVAHRDHALVFQQERHVIESGDQWRGVRESRKRFERLAQTLLERVASAGAAAPVDTRLALSALLGMANHTPQWYRPRGRLTPEEIADGYTALLLA
jgi:AcrR family transcriptional regulator